MAEKTKEITIELMNNGKAISSFGNGKESVKWYFGDDGKKLFLDPFEQKNMSDKSAGQVMIFDIVSVTDNTMRLRVHQPVGQDVFLNLSRIKETAGTKK